MSFQQEDFSRPAPKRQESALQRQMAEFDAKKAGRSVSYTEDTRETSPSSKSKRNGTPHPKGSPHAPPSPDRDGKYAGPTRRGTHSPPRSDNEAEYQQNIRTTGGNGRDKEEKWVGNNLPRPGVHGAPEGDFGYADNIKVTGGRGKDMTVEWQGEEAPAITHHHQWTSDNEEEEDQSASRKKKSPKSKKYKNKDGDHVEEADGSDNEINAHHKWRPDSEAQANYKPEKSKKSKKSSSRSSHDEPRHSGDEDEDRFQAPPRTRTYIDRNGDEVVEAADPDNTRITHNHQWTD